MRGKPCWESLLAGSLLAGAVVLLYPAIGNAQPHDDRSPDERGKASTSWRREGSDKPSVPDPYGGQLFCPVTGAKLGLTHPPVAVQTTIGEQKPSFWGKMFGRKPVPGTVIYVCCPACAEKVRGDPMRYLDEVIADKGVFAFTYANAPARRPPRAAIEPGNQTGTITAIGPSQVIRPVRAPPP